MVIGSERMRRPVAWYTALAMATSGVACRYQEDLPLPQASVITGYEVRIGPLCGLPAAGPAAPSRVDLRCAGRGWGAGRPARAWGGNRTWTGAQTWQALSSVLATARVQQRDPVGVLVALLRAPCRPCHPQRCRSCWVARAREPRPARPTQGPRPRDRHRTGHLRRQADVRAGSGRMRLSAWHVDPAVACSTHR
jgi:hypothetical protein